MSRTRLYLVVFLSITIASGAVYWWNADWWAYVAPIGDEGWKPKFTMPVWWQVIESAFVGSLISTAVMLLFIVVYKMIRKD